MRASVPGARAKGPEVRERPGGARPSRREEGADRRPGRRPRSLEGYRRIEADLLASGKGT